MSLPTALRDAAQGRYTEALRGFRAARLADPSSVQALAGEALCTFHLHELDAALPLLQQAVAALPRNELLLSALLSTLTRSHQVRGAIALAQQLLQCTPPLGAALRQAAAQCMSAVFWRDAVMRLYDSYAFRDLDLLLSHCLELDPQWALGWALRGAARYQLSLLSCKAFLTLTGEKASDTEHPLVMGQAASSGASARPGRMPRLS